MKSTIQMQTKATSPAGFTLVELLLVMVVIAILGMIILGSAGYITRVARRRRAEVTCRVLETALTRYRADYDRWPVSPSSPGSYKVTKTGTANREAFGPLRVYDKNNNKRQIRYVDETTLYTVDNKDRPISLDKAGKGAKPLIYLTRDDGKVKYFKVVIDVDQDTVKVSTPELND